MIIETRSVDSLTNPLVVPWLLFGYVWCDGTRLTLSADLAEVVISVECSHLSGSGASVTAGGPIPWVQ